jgi:hypothetical protein
LAYSQSSILDIVARLFVVAQSVDGFDFFNFFNSDIFDLWQRSPENSATYGSAGLVWAVPLSLVVESKSAKTAGGDNRAVSLDLLIASYGFPEPGRAGRYRTSELSSLSDLKSRCTNANHRDRAKQC